MFFLSYIKTHHPAVFSALKNLRSFISTPMENPTADAGSSAAQPPFDPSQPAVPISYPLRTLEELESRSYFKSFHYPFNQAAVKLSPAAIADFPRRRRILACHDMAGGYTDDKFVQGGTNPDAYAIWHWYLIDVFVYFSHNLVTLPPPSWINSAHRHGVKVLGTFIMEWDEGAKLANQLLSTKDSAEMYADRLTELAVALSFDGWLINMEVKLEAAQIPILKGFVSYLSQTMHSSLPGSLVIWYDSVTIDGDLTWQNQLNDKNKPFFDLCDGIFVNYTWLKDFPKQSADVAGDRKFDVYMGIDVFGRKTFGGGQWTTNTALDVIKENDVSAAIFAPGWVYETKQQPDFQTAQNRWWGLVEKSWDTVQTYPKELPFYSNFDQGHGYHIYRDGEHVSGTSWNNISLQSFQPFIQYPDDSTSQSIKVSINFKDASYSGGGNIEFSGTLADNAVFTARLFKAALSLETSPIHFTYSVKSSSEDSLLGLVLMFSSATEEKKSVLLAASGDALLTMNQFSSRFTSVIMPHRVTKLEQGWIIQENSIVMAGHTLIEIHAMCYRSKRGKSHDPSEYSSTLGDIKITTDGGNSNFPPANAWLVGSQFINWTSGPQESKLLSVKITWQLRVGNADVFPKYNIYVDKIKGNQSLTLATGREYLGATVGKAFYVSGLEVPSGISSLKFIVQMCGVDGTSQKVEDCPFLELKVEGS